MSRRIRFIRSSPLLPSINGKLHISIYHNNKISSSLRGNTLSSILRSGHGVVSTMIKKRIAEIFHAKLSSTSVNRKLSKVILEIPISYRVQDGSYDTTN